MNMSAKAQPSSSGQQQVPMLLSLHGYFNRDPLSCVMPGVVPKALRQSPQLAGNEVLCRNFCVCTPLAPSGYYWMRKDPESQGGGLSGEWYFEPEYRPLMADALRALVMWLPDILPVDPAQTYLTGNSMVGTVRGSWHDSAQSFLLHWWSPVDITHHAQLDGWHGWFVPCGRHGCRFLSSMGVTMMCALSRRRKS